MSQSGSLASDLPEDSRSFPLVTLGCPVRAQRPPFFGHRYSVAACRLPRTQQLPQPITPSPRTTALAPQENSVDTGEEAIAKASGVWYDFARLSHLNCLNESKRHSIQGTAPAARHFFV
jgi:hypothetical protein